MKEYFYPSLFFKKKWIWFADPFDVSDADMVNFFSYNKTDREGFKRKKGITTVIDLSKSFDDIWINMRKKFIRKQINKGEKNGVIIKQDNNFNEFKKVYFNFRRDKQLAKDKYKVLKDNGLLFSAYYNKKIIAGGVFIADGQYMRAWALASARFWFDNGKIKEIIGQANRMIIWEAIKYAKEKGHKIFDLGGIKPNSFNQRRRAVAEFKEGFGGGRKNCFYYHKTYSKLLNFLTRLKKWKI